MKKGKKEGEMKELGRDRKRGHRRRRKGEIKEKLRRDREGGYRREIKGEIKEEVGRDRERC